MSGMPIKMDCGAGADDCALLCATRSGCKSWAATVCGGEQHCWLKHSVPGKSSKNCVVSTTIFLVFNFTLVNSVQASGLKPVPK